MNLCFRGRQCRRPALPTLAAAALFLIGAAAALFLSSCGDPPPAESAYLSEVLEYRYSPGQHASTIAYDDAAACVGEPGPDFLLLGGWGGYLTAGFDHVVANAEGYDFAVFTQGGSGSEPGVVYVMEDADGNGAADETWYELSGSETGADYSAETGGSLDRYIRDYEVTYARAVTAEANVTWEDNQGNSGELACEYPAGSTSASWWMEDWGDTLILSGVKLPDIMALSGSSWENFDDRFSWGYAENYGGDDYADLDDYSANRFDISDAIDSDGNHVELAGIRFIRVQTGVFQQAGMLNEISTEIRGAADLSLLEWEE